LNEIVQSGSSITFMRN